MNPNQALWEKGDFTMIAAFMRESGEQIAQSLPLQLPARVLDLGCGDGTTAVPIAQRGAEVVGIDIARNLVEAGKKRASTLNLDRLTFRVGDASSLADVDDQAFDMTVTVFGAMFAPKPFDVAREMVRVTKPGGQILMGNWIPNDPTSFVSQLLRISSAYTPPPPDGFVSPMTWGVESNIVERFEKAGVNPENVSMEKDVYHFYSSASPEQFIETFKHYYGPTMNAFDAAQKNGTEEQLHKELVELARAQNKSANGGTAISATFMRVIVQV